MFTEAINLAQRLFLDSAGMLYPITNLIDGAGEETDDPAAAVCVVAGAGNRWYSISLADFEAAVFH